MTVHHKRFRGLAVRVFVAADVIEKGEKHLVLYVERLKRRRMTLKFLYSFFITILK